ncbi:MAG: hypothetical protein LRY71_17345 [Bacillaceae bacterium]|nr:hypothetical protein [Bacillaceae bacterium]
MNNQRYSLEKIEETISNWADNTALIKEGEGTRFLHFLMMKKIAIKGMLIN